MAWPTTPEVKDFRYWDVLQTRLDVYRNATTQSGGNVGLVTVHGGGWAGNTKNTQNLTSEESYDLANYVLTSGQTAQKWSVIPVDYRMGAYTGGIKSSYPSYFPESFGDVSYAVQAIKDNARLYGTNPALNAKSWGINPNKIVLFGTSAGSTNCMLTSLRRSEPYYVGGTWRSAQRFQYGSSSIPALVINNIGPIDFRFDTALGVETFRYDALPLIFGTSTTDAGVEWGLIPADMKAAASPLAYLQQGKLEARPAGMTHVYFTTLADPKPYDSLHPSEQGPIIHAACLAAQIDSDLQVITPGAWKDYAPTPATSPSWVISKRITQFCEARLAA